MASACSKLVLLLLPLELCSLAIVRGIPDTRVLWWAWARRTPMWLKRPDQEGYFNPEVPTEHCMASNWKNIEKIWCHPYDLVPGQHPVLLTSALEPQG